MVVRAAAPIIYKQMLFDKCNAAVGHDACDMPRMTGVYNTENVR